MNDRFCFDIQKEEKDKKIIKIIIIINWINIIYICEKESTYWKVYMRRWKASLSRKCDDHY